MVIEAEQFKASIELPKGKIPFATLGENNQDNDDNFFHLMCYIDSTLKSKIEKGEFVELEKLLPKRRYFKNDEGCLEWVMREGMTYLAPASDKEARIINVKNWDQAFRVYAAIYCNANPQRSAEVWQYIYVIHSAASSYQWDNVAYYDYTFRQLMAEKPMRSWSKTYVQMWQLVFRDPIVKNSNWSQSSTGTSGHTTGGKTNAKHRDWRDNCCWKFNRSGKSDRNDCPYDNRCSYCRIWNSHGSNSCRKKNGGNNNSNNSKMSLAKQCK